MERKRFSARIHGRVQRVGFRYFAVETAGELRVTGYVRNADDGTVEVVAEGDEGPLSRYLVHLHEGPRPAEVTHIDVTWEEPTGKYDRFHVKG